VEKKIALKIQRYFFAYGKQKRPKGPFRAALTKRQALD